MQALFTHSFLNTLDECMSCYYDQYTSRTDYLSFLSYLERSMYSHNNEEKGVAYFEHNKLRVFFGQKQVKKVRKWKLDMIISRLMDKNVIIRTDYDRKRGKTRRYAYHIWFIFDQKVPVFGLKSEEIDQKLTDSYASKVNLSDKDIAAQYKLLISERFNINIEKSLQWIDREYNDRNTITANQKMFYTRMVLDLYDKRIYVVKGDKSGRIFTNYNLIKREFRNFCTIDGERLLNVDLKTSQPYLLASLLKKNFPSEESDDLFNLVTNDDIYTWFLKKANEAGISSYQAFDSVTDSIKTYNLMSRDDSKVAFMRFLFSNTKRGIRPVYEVIFKKEFPVLFKEIRKIDSLATVLQTQESRIFIPVASKYAKRGCLSVHDGLSFKSGLRSEILSDLQSKFSSESFSNYKLINH